MNYSLYIHVPFCSHRCAYCDFNTYAGQEDSIPAYVDALRREIELVGCATSEKVPVHTVFFGGGTPNLLSPAQFKTILDSVRCNFDLGDDAEVTTEANPGTVSYGALAELRSVGLNRISFGAQSANAEELKLLERTHSFLEVMQAVESARRAGFSNLNLDLIYGLPEQQLEIWKTTVQRVLDLHPEHISAYALTLEHGTPFGRWSARGLLPSPDADTAAEMYEWAANTFEAAGYQQYEISNWARSVGGAALTPAGQALGTADRPTYACRHNLQYWKCGPYLGFGAGAHGYAGGYRYSNALRIKTYIARLQDGGVKAFPMSPATVDQHLQSTQDDMSEFMIMGLRLTREGISPEDFQERFQFELTDVYAREVEELIGLGLLEWRHAAPQTLRLTERAKLLGNQVFVRFV
jgi:oxygen-independent coproporphyrinogen-3 oxidase